MLYAILIAILLIADQWVKYWTTINIVLDTGESALIPGFVKLVNVHNSGAAFGFLNSVEYMRWIFAGIAIVFAVVLAIIMIRRVFPGKFPTILCAVAIAGALGNCIDRFIYGYVVDMFKLEFINFAVFNVADVLLTVSCFLFIIYLLFGYKGDDKDKDDDDDFIESFTKVDSFDENAFDLSGIDSMKVEETEPSKPITIDSAFWASGKETVKKEVEQEVQADPQEEPEKAPEKESFDFDSILNEKEPVFEKESSAFDEYSLDSILEEFK